MRLLILLCLSLSSGCASVLAQTPDAPLSSTVGPPPQTQTQQETDRERGAVSSITIEEALVFAEQNSPLLLRGTASVEGSQAGVLTAKTYTNPTVDFLAGHQFARPIATPGVPGLLQHYAAGQTIEIPSERRTRIQGSQLQLQADEYLLAAIRLSVVADVKRAFYEVVRRKEQLANTKDNLALVEDLRRRVSVEVQVGEKGKLELTRAEAELARARAAVNSADVEVASARATLKAVMGAPAGQNFDTQGAAVDRATLAPLSELRQLVLANHPALAEANSRTAQSKVLVENERARRIPQPTVLGEYEVQPDQTFFRFGVNVPLPLWDKRKGPIAQAQAAVKRSEADARQRQLEVMAALERAYDQYEINDQQVQSMQASQSEAEAAVEAARSAYRFGERGILEVLDAQRVLQGVRTDLLDALFARQSALIDLEELGAIHP